ncbi:electron transfer flavoprotein subunit beta/FixA family protein [Kosmotoga pacifica]|uniref:Electron transfer flavoprotein subunit beta n=1 Tax=Kosmotoga pacifica TaxID=1330330 RepID=A0A0G2Z7W5_9BACT|nr:electron transfer flavoprotein subunit beta/FixA family protein [Kosmotoga pacifica]AKI97642.1 electron transfer flavoprotein subunit beta [Kosmotoga pacifica]
MNIVVSIKQVPDTTNVRIDRSTGNLIREGIPAIINPDDLHAIEEAVKIREKFGGKVLVITMGPPMAASALKEAISQGADEAFLLSDRRFAGADTLATTYTLYHGIKKIEEKYGTVDLVFTGKQAVDGDTGQVGPGLATRLGYSLIAYVTKIEEVTPEKVVAWRRLEKGLEKIEAKIPAVLTITSEANEVRYSPLDDMIRAVKYKPESWDADLVGADPKKTGILGSPTKVVRTNIPPARAGGEIIANNLPPEETADKFIEALLKEEAVKLLEFMEPLVEGDKNG